MTTSELLFIALGVLKKNGWTQDDFWESDPYDDDADVPPRDCPVCALGAINVAGGHDPDDELEGERLEAARALALYLGFAPEQIATPELVVEEVGNAWNDAADRTFKHVLAAIHATACAEREAGR